MNVSDDELREGSNEFFNMVDEDRGGNVSKKELLSLLFKIVDKDQNMHLDNKDLRGMVKSYA